MKVRAYNDWKNGVHCVTLAGRKEEMGIPLFLMALVIGTAVLYNLFILLNSIFIKVLMF